MMLEWVHETTTKQVSSPTKPAESSGGSDSDPCMGNLEAAELQARVQKLIKEQKKSRKRRESRRCRSANTADGEAKTQAKNGKVCVWIPVNSARII